MSTFTTLALPNGTQITNRLAKAAMEENLADLNHAPSDELIRLYQAWAEGGVGLMITGNVMVDRRAMTGPGGVVLENAEHKARFEQWAKVARSHGAQVWMQINHPGRQMQAAMGQTTVAPSAVALDMGKFSKQFAVPKAMTETDIAEVKARFVTTAVLAEQSGFNGVQIHAAHGYLLSQFLSPITNKRDDQWGGSIENRARLLVDIVKDVRAAVGHTFSVAVKLNSADFQRGGFSQDEARHNVRHHDHTRPIDALDPAQPVRCVRQSHQRIRMAVAYLVFRLQHGHLLHVLQIADGLQDLEPVLDWLAVLLLNRGEVGSWAFHLFVRRHCSSPHDGMRQPHRHVVTRVLPCLTDEQARSGST